MKLTPFLSGALCAITALVATPGAAQQSVPDGAPQGPPEGAPQGPPDFGESVFDDAWVTIGVGAGLGPSYNGSDDYVVFPLPVLQGELGGVRFSPRPAGLAVDLIPDADDAPVSVSAGPTFRLRNDRADQVEDEVVLAAGELDRAVEVGAALGLGFNKVLNPFDSLTLGLDARWDVAGAHDGMVIEPSLTYFTPVSRATIVSLTLSAGFVDDSFADYYYSVSPAQSAASGLPEFQADGGLDSLGANLLVIHDLDGNALNGGWSIVGIGGYSRQIGDSKTTPYTAIRGSANQFLLGAGVAYTF